MFKLNVPITKSFQKKNGKFVVEGIASDPTIDRDEERFELAAITSMAESVNKGSIPIRIEHEDKVYTDIGIWTEAGVVDNKLYVKGELDTELSLGKDISVLLNRGLELALSVGGRILDAGYEYSKELKKTIKVYKDVILEEISIIKNPSNYNVKLSMAKSVNWDKDATKPLEHTTEARKIAGVYKAMEKITNVEFIEKHITKEQKELIKTAKTKTPTKAIEGYTSKEWSVDVMKTLAPWFKQVEKEYDDEVVYYEEDNARLTTADLKMIGQLMNVMANVDLPDGMARPAIMDTDDFWDLVEEQQVVLYNREMTTPHHNKDLSLNKELVLWYTKSLVDNQMWYTPKDYMVIFSHLYRHLKDLALVKSTKVSASVKKKVSNEELKLFKQCHLYLNSHGTAKPTLNGVTLSVEHVNKCALAYKLLTNHRIMADDKKVTKAVEEVVVPAAEEVVVEEKKEEVAAEEVVAEVVVEAPAAEVVAEEVVEEAAPVEVVEAAPVVEEVVAEEVPAVVEAPAAVEEVVAEVVAEEVVKEEVVAEKSVTKVAASFNKAAFDKMEKSVGQLAEIVNGLVEKAKDANTLEDTVVALGETVTKQTEVLAEMSKRSLGRKSVAAYAVIEKNFQEPHKTEDSQTAALKKMADGVSFRDAYKAMKSGE